MAVWAVVQQQIIISMFFTTELKFPAILVIVFQESGILLKEILLRKKPARFGFFSLHSFWVGGMWQRDILST